MSNSKTIDVNFKSSFFDSIKNITNITKSLVIKPFGNGRVGLVQRSEGGEITVNLSADKSSFNYEKEISIKNFPSFYNTFKALNDPKVSIKESEAEVPVSIILNDGTTKIEFALQKPTAIRHGKPKLPDLVDGEYVSFTIDDNMLKDIKTLTNNLIVDKAEDGSRLVGTYEEDSESIVLHFKAIKALGNSFTKTLPITNKADESFDITLDPMFFTWLPNGSYEIVLSNSEIKYIRATMNEVDGENKEIATYVFIAGQIS